MRKKFTFLLMVLLALAGFKSWGQETEVQIGSGSQLSTVYPFQSYYNYSYNQFFYTAAEISTAAQNAGVGTINGCTINSISFDAGGDDYTRTYSFNIYMKNVSRNNFANSLDDWETISDANLVGQGTITSATTGWVTFNLSNPFDWDGTSNLLIAFDNNSSVYGNKKFYCFQNSDDYTYRAKAAYSDVNNFDPSNPPTSYDNYNNYFDVNYIRPNIKLSIETGPKFNVTINQPEVGGTISADPMANVAPETAVTLSATPSFGYEFGQWTVVDEGGNPVILNGEATAATNGFSMPESNVTVSATFNSLTQHAITVIQPDNQEEVGTFTADPTQAYKDERINLSYNLKQYDGYGYKFTGWTVYKTDDPTTTVSVIPDWGSSYHFTMPDYPVTVSAEYEQETYYALTIDNGIEHGDVYASPSQHITAGTMVQLNPYPDAGYDFGGWDVYYTENPDNKITVEYNRFEMPVAAVTVTATFTAKELYTVSIGTTENGTINLIEAPADNKYYQGQQVKFNVTPDAGYMIDEVTYICGQTVNIWYDSYWGYYYFTMPEAAVTINASFVMGITVHDGTDVSDNIPVYGSYADTYNTKSQFIFPAADLTAIKDTKITDLTFYTQNVSAGNFGDLTWTVFMKEVDYITPSSFVDWNDMTNVYEGTINISDYKLTIHLSTPFEYNGGNLMIGFRENEWGVFLWTQWLGDFNNYDAYHSIATNYNQEPEQFCFLPKTTIIYEPVVNYAITLVQPEDEDEIGTIAAYANGVEVSKASEGTQITLEHNFNLGYRFNYWTVNGEQISGNTFEMPANAVTVAANYEALTQYNINCATLDEGTIHAEYNGVTISEAPAGTEITLVAEANTSYSFDHFIVNGEPIVGNTYTMPDSEITVSATFLLAHTVYDGLSDNDYCPFYVFYADDFTKSNMIMPAADLADMAGGTISSMKFYVSRITDDRICYSNWQVYLKEVSENETTGPVDVTTATMVYEGVIDFKVAEITINFTEPFAYNGGNLLIATQNTTDMSYSHVYFFGKDNTYGYVSSGRGYNSVSLNNVTSWGQTSSFLPKTTFIYTPGATRYNITCDDAITGGSISADPVKAAAGTVVNLSATPDYGYEFGAWVENYEDVEIVNNQFTMPEHDVNISATFSELPKYDIISATVTGGTVHAECNDVTITQAIEGTVITLVAEAATDYIFEYFTVDGVQIEGNTYTMGTSAIEIGASFRQLQSYTITYYVNGSVQKTLHPKENAFISIVEPSSTVIPAGTTFAGWSREDITTYQTTEPVFVGNTEHPTEDCSLYAVLSYSEMGGATAWTKVTDFSELQNGNKVVIAAMNGENTGYTLNESCEFTGSATCSALPATFGNSGATIAALPEGTTQFTVGLNTIYANYLSLTGENGDLVHWDYNLNVPAGAEPETTDNWFEFYDSKLVAGYTSDWDELYVILHNYDSYGGINMRFGIEQIQPGYYDAAYLYKQQGALATYYMTSVLTDGEVTENTTAKNIIITTGTVTVNEDVVLTMNENGLFRNENAANFVFGYGAQLITDNTGVLATMKKHINGTEWYTISSPLAESVNVTDVTNLIPTTVTETDYDLYRLNETAFSWENARPETNQEPAFTTIDKGVGYIYSNNAGADYIAFAGEINVEDVECTLTNGGGHGFNLIGNPFSQNITLADVAGTAELAGGYYVLSNENTWGAMIETGNIAPLQGFLVQATTAGNATISKPASTGKGERSNEKNTNIEVIVSNSNYRDNAYAMFGEGTGLNKISHRNAEAPMVYIPQGGEDFAIAFMDENTTLFPVSFKAMTTGKYSISLKATEDVNTLVLIDNMTGTETNMLLEESYSFIGSPADRDNRFTVKLGISQNNGQNDNEHFVYQYGNELVIDGEGMLQVFDVLGRVVISEEVHGQRVNIGSLIKGAYIVRMTGENVMTQKIIVK
ncbi:MAG: T9SS type A sorting domain-containing protein [Bacteroidales bacterium]|nr:T9SS type A sorting domain-containing protein [Bacteroidales bacterium]